MRAGCGQRDRTVCAAATILSQVVHQTGHDGEHGRVDNESPGLARLDEADEGQVLEMKGKRVRRKIKPPGNVTSSHTFGARLNQGPKDRQSCFMAQRRERPGRFHVFHISTLLEILKYCKPVDEQHPCHSRGGY